MELHLAFLGQQKKMVKLYLTQINNGIIYMIALQQNIIFLKKERRSIYHYIINIEHELYSIQLMQIIIMPYHL